MTAIIYGIRSFIPRARSREYFMAFLNQSRGQTQLPAVLFFTIKAATRKRLFLLGCCSKGFSIWSSEVYVPRIEYLVLTKINKREKGGDTSINVLG
jgi:hypothetical protein